MCARVAVAYSITFLVMTFSTLKWDETNRLWHDGEYGLAYLVCIGFTTALALTAALLTLWAPQAAVSTKKSVSRSQLRSLSLGLHQRCTRPDPRSLM